MAYGAYSLQGLTVRKPHQIRFKHLSSAEKR